MKFWIGFILGAGAAGLALSQLDERQRERLARSAVQAARTGRSGDIATSVSDGVGGIADVATDRVTTAVDTATTRAAELIERPQQG